MAPLFEHIHNDKKELISPERRFNLEAMIQASIEDDIKEEDATGPRMEEHEHGEDYHVNDNDDDEKKTNHFGISDEGHHGFDREYRRHDRDHQHYEEHGGEWREPANYYFEYPHRPEQHHHVHHREDHH